MKIYNLILLMVDIDGDGRPDINLDFDGDGTPDINVDVDGDWIPDMNIDSTGDGKADVNVDTDNDGKPDENIIKITEWKPGHNVDDPFPYDTMTFDDPKDPDDPNNQDPDTDVKGAYYPGKHTGGAQSVGGALTGDTTNIMIYMGMGSMSIGMMLFILFKRKRID